MSAICEHHFLDITHTDTMAFINNENIPTKPARIITSLAAALGGWGHSAVYEAGVEVTMG